MSKLHVLKLFTKKAMIVVVPVLITLLITYLLTASADPCDKGRTAGGTTRFVDSCEE